MKLQWLKWLHAHSFQLFLVDIYLILWGLFSRAVIILEWGCSHFVLFCFLIMSFTSVSAVIIWWDFSHPCLTTPANGRVTLSSLISYFLFSCCPSLCVPWSTKKKQRHTTAAFLKKYLQSKPTANGCRLSFHVWGWEAVMVHFNDHLDEI